MAFTVETWNLQNGLGDSLRSKDIIAEVAGRNPDVAVFAEACGNTEEEPFLEAVEKFEESGYITRFAAYDDSDVRTDSHGMLVISRLSDSMEVARIATRNALGLEVVDPVTNITVRWAAAHLDDRLESTRLTQSRSLLTSGLLPADGPRGIAGDLNTMPRSRHYCPSPALADRLPVTSVHFHTRWNLYNKVARAYSVGSRAMRMASGRTLEYLHESGLRDADGEHLPTIPSHRPLFQLDHILVSREISVRNFTRQPHTGLSDHRSVSALLEV